MDNKTIKYIAFYEDLETNTQNRSNTPSTYSKLNFIFSVLVENGYSVEIISPSWTNNKKGFYRGEVKQVSPGVSLRTFATFGAKYRILRIFKYLFSLLQLFLFILFNIEKGSQLFVYHSTILAPVISMSKKIKKYNLILEVEEIYQDIQNYSKIMKRLEYNLINLADKYMVSSDMLGDLINRTNKPCIVLYGSYEKSNVFKLSKYSPKIHVVYAGTFDTRKGGAEAAINSALYLTSDYHLHILGFGKPEEVDYIKKLINSYSGKTKCTLTYDGLLEGEKYSQFLSRCHIGLSTQTPYGKYNDSSFPSKILSYMAHGLAVVSIKIKAVERSSISKYLTYYENQNGEELSQAIMRVNLEKIDNRKVIKRLREDFSRELREFLGE